MNTGYFYRIFVILCSLCVIFGVLVAVLLLTANDPSESLYTRAVSAYGALLGGMIGLVSGFLVGVGSRNGNGHK